MRFGLMSEAAKIATTNPTGAADLLKGLKGSSGMSEALLGQILQSGISEGLTQQKAQGVFTRGGGLTGTPGAPPSSAPGLTIDVTKPNLSGTPQTPDAAIAGIETGGNNDYRAIGPVSLVNGRPARPYGKYQVMDFNIGPWTKEVTGQEMTPEQFVKDPQAQEAVFKTKFGQYTQQYGPNGAARAWFAGPGGMNNPNAADVNGTTVAQYGNKFDQATGAQPPAPQGTQVAQAQSQGPQPTPPQIGQIPIAPDAADFARQAHQYAQQGDYVKANQYKDKAIEAQAKFATGLQTEQAKVGMTGAEHDRQQNTAPLNSEQGLSATFADRMAHSGPIINKYEKALTNPVDAGLNTKAFGVGIPGSNAMVSNDYQAARQAADNFIYAVLRRETGAAVGAGEYEKTEKQYIPQPWDTPEVLAQKAKDREIALTGMARAAGPAYQPKAAPQQGAAPAQGGGGDILSQAREAIKQGAPRDKVIERLKQQGIDASGL